MNQPLCKFFSLAIISVFSNFLFAQQSTQWQSKVSPALLSKFDHQSTTSFVVVMNEQADLSYVKNIHGKEAKGNFVYQTLSELARNSQQVIISELENENISFQSFWVMNALLVNGNEQTLEKLAQRSDVKNILDNSAMSFAKPVFTQINYDRDVIIPWGLDSIHVPEVWALGIKGEGVVVGGQDTGYDWEHPALKDHYRGWNGTTADHNYNWHDNIHEPDPHNAYPNPCGIDITAPCDDYGHGTHTMGTMVGDDGVNAQIGMAPGAKWIGCRNMDQGNGTPARYMECMQWFLAPTRINGNDPADQYARLYAADVVDAIGRLNLPRYGLANYLAPAPQENRLYALQGKERRRAHRLSKG